MSYVCNCSSRKDNNNSHDAKYLARYSHLTFTVTLQGRYCYYTDCIDEEQL